MFALSEVVVMIMVSHSGVFVISSCAFYLYSRQHPPRDTPR